DSSTSLAEVLDGGQQGRKHQEVATTGAPPVAGAKQDIAKARQDVRKEHPDLYNAMLYLMAQDVAIPSQKSQQQSGAVTVATAQKQNNSKGGGGASSASNNRHNNKQPCSSSTAAPAPVQVARMPLVAYDKTRDAYQATKLGTAIVRSGMDIETGYQTYDMLMAMRKKLLTETDLHVCYMCTPFASTYHASDKNKAGHVGGLVENKGTILHTNTTSKNSKGGGGAGAP
ncbi:unnamed protein product, partial [Amoebophrya sp. A120]